MKPKYSYGWYRQQFEQAKETAETFLLAVDEVRFLQPPAHNRWSIAECYSHLIRFGHIYYQPVAHAIGVPNHPSAQKRETFPPRWICRPAVWFLEPPYSIKMNTFDSMKPQAVTGYNRMELLDEFLNLQDQFIAQLERAQRQQTDLAASKQPHPIFRWIKLRCSEFLLLTLAHQRRHHWQAEQTLKMLAEQS